MRHTTIARTLCACALTAASGLISIDRAGANAPPSTVLADGTVQYIYGRRPQPIVICAPHYVCDIALDGGESVLNMAIGDATHWVIAGGQSGPSGATPHIFVKPSAADLDTNLVITTNRRVYDVGLHSTAMAKHGRISFAYLDELAAARGLDEQRAISAVLAGTPLVAADQADAKYKFSGEAEIMPQRVFNDGVRTYIVWQALPPELPSVVSIAKDGSSQALNFRVVGAQYIIDTCEPNFDLVLTASSDRHGRPERRVAIRHL